MAIPSSNNDYNTAIGFSSLDQLLIGNYNCFVGVKADGSFGHTTGSYNVHVGGTVGANLNDYSDNVVISGDASNILPPPLDLTVIGNTVVGNTNQFSNTSAPVTIVGFNNNNGGGVGPYSSITNLGANNVLTGSTLINIGNGNNIAFNNCLVIGNAQTPAAANTLIIGDASHTSVIIGGVTLSSPTGAVFPNGVIVGNAGTEGSGINVNGTTYNSTFKTMDIAGTNIAQSILHRHSTTWEPIQVFARSNSDTAAHTAVTAGMAIHSLYAAGYCTSFYNLFSRIHTEVTPGGTVSDTSAPGDIVFSTTRSGTVFPAESLRINSQGAMVGSSTLTVSGTHALSLSSTWNNAAGVFSGIFLDVTDTASNFTSSLMTLLVGGSVKFGVSKFGDVTSASGIVATGALGSYAGAVAGLPLGSLGLRAMVTDSTQTLAAGIGTAVVGGGANIVPVFHDGTSWKIG